MPIDVVIVGSSVAGLSAALTMLDAEIKPVLFERKSVLGKPVQCAEYVPAPFVSIVPFARDCIAQRTSGMEAFIAIGEDEKPLRHFVSAPGYILHRDKWEQMLAAQACRMGAKIFPHEKVLSIKQNETVCTLTTTKRTVETKVVIGADGPRSTTAKEIGLGEQKLLPAIQWTVPLKRHIENTMLFFHPDFYGGYGWLFPKGMVGNLGVGAESANRQMLHRVIDFFSEFIVPVPIETTAGLIPISGMRSILSFGRVVLAGDAAGTTDPITGAGIANAWESGQTAAKAAEKFLNDEAELSSAYEEKIRFLRKALRRAYLRRLKLLQNGDIDGRRFAQQILSVWNFR